MCTPECNDKMLPAYTSNVTEMSAIGKPVEYRLCLPDADIADITSMPSRTSSACPEGAHVLPARRRVVCATHWLHGSASEGGTMVRTTAGCRGYERVANCAEPSGHAGSIICTRWAGQARGLTVGL